MLNNFIYAKTKDLFEAQLKAGNILDEAIVFIEDTKEMWNHGGYYSVSTLSENYLSVMYPEILDEEGNPLFIPTVSGLSYENAINTLDADISTLVQEVLDNEKVISKAIIETANSIGLDTNFNYITNTESNYISSATSLAEADNMLDAAIKEIDNTIVTNGVGNKFLADNGLYLDIGINNDTLIVDEVNDDDLILINPGYENKAVRADELVKGGKEVFIITPDMFEETTTVSESPYPSLTFTDDGLNKFKEAVEANKIIGINKSVFSFIENGARPLTAGIESGNYVFSTYVGVMEYGYALSFEILNTVTADIDRYEVSIVSKDFNYMKNMSANGSFYLEPSMFVEPAAGEPFPGLELMEVYKEALYRAIDSHKIIKIEYNVLGYLDMIATPYAIAQAGGYFILDNIIKLGDSSFQATVILPETNYHLTINYNNGIFTADSVDMSDTYILYPDTYSTAEDFRLLQGAIDNNRVIQLIVNNIAFIGTVASKSDSSILITIGIVFPDYYSMDNPVIQYGAYSFNSDGTVNKVNLKSLYFETTENGTKFLADDGSYKEAALAPYIWDGTTSETIFNELKTAIESNKVIVNNTNQHILPIAVVNQTIYLYLPKSFDLFAGIEGNDVVYSVTSQEVVTEIGGAYIKKTSDRYATNELQSNTYRDFGILNKNTTFGFYNFTSVMSISEFAGQFSFGDTLYTITFPAAIKWSTDSVLEYKANHTYQFRIVNNLGVMKEFANS